MASSLGRLEITDVTLDDVTASGNMGVDGGVSINNTAGSGYVSIDPSTFDGNTGGNGLSILSRGDVTLLDVIANGNHDYGTYLNNITGGGNVSVNNSTLRLKYQQWSANRIGYSHEWGCQPELRLGKRSPGRRWYSM